MCNLHYSIALPFLPTYQMIFSREYTQAEGKAWHVHHFCCTHCDVTLAGQRYIAKDNNPYCVTCFDKLFSKVRAEYADCGVCNISCSL